MEFLHLRGVRVAEQAVHTHAGVDALAPAQIVPRFTFGRLSALRAFAGMSSAAAGAMLARRTVRAVCADPGLIARATFEELANRTFAPRSAFLVRTWFATPKLRATAAYKELALPASGPQAAAARADASGVFVAAAKVVTRPTD